jgi:hypothetical protein
VILDRFVLSAHLGYTFLCGSRIVAIFITPSSRVIIIFHRQVHEPDCVIVS